MRPDSVIWFERLSLASVALGVFQSGHGWKEATALASVPFVLFIQIFVSIFIVTMVLLVSRRHSRIAMWALIVLFVLGLPTIYAVFAAGLYFGVQSLAVIQTTLQFVALILLFTPASRAWLKAKPFREPTAQP